MLFVYLERHVAGAAILAKPNCVAGKFCLARVRVLRAYAGMNVNRRHVLMSASGLLAGACAQSPVQPIATLRPSFPGAPLKISEDRLMRMTVCTRPFRPAGPRIEREMFGEKTVVHNYGHGGSGWSLSWGCAEDAVALTQPGETTHAAVIGAGVIGLTTALRLIQTGANVTIYAKDLPRETRSARATGVWSPSSRIGLRSAVSEGFGDTWERWARSSYQTHQHYIGSLGAPVEYVPFYSLRSHTPPPGSAAQRDFLHLSRRVRNMMPRGRSLSDDAHAFPVASAWRSLDMAFNIAAYTDRLVRDFLAMGGRMVRKSFTDRAEVLALPESLIMNCTGYGAKTLWGAEDLAPVRGQINWMPPQPEARYGLYHEDVYVLSRGDGVIVQYTGPNDDYGYGIEDETPDRDEMRRAVATVEPLFSAALA